MSSEARLKKLSELIMKKGSLSVQDLADEFQVSDMTIRRDLKKLEQSGLFQRYHGGIRYVREELPVQRESQSMEEKKRIAEFCLTLISSNDSIFLDSGTTAHCLAVALAESSLQNVTVITNSLTTAYALRYARNVSLYMAGGEFRINSQAFLGSKSRMFLEGLYVNKAFVGTSGVIESGFSTFSFSDAETKQLMIQSSELSCIMADSSKFGKRSMNLFATIDSVDMVVADNGLSDYWAKIFKDKGVDLRLV
ncbi:transcriptional regulator of sugar metabolism [Thermobacillus composti KWC4]|uniref:Transcriptional regulator of sugar metabolism n=1 Tax=Thermobacillus composti (strain DSM 18247 / JCM 13945 / KWC4) TaxID=717605 RepID=L0EC50_THECK|nr:DeoR/GlpR family DNA-binding transcription regulator [Thermobacillus composti]AGA57352.1 transcriptional regulator of sugar metabolism [Thermobacillus composti KWC4]